MNTFLGRPRMTALQACSHTLLLTALLGASGTVLAAAPAPNNTSINTANARTVATAFQAWATQTGSVFDLLAADMRWTIHGSGPVARTYLGIDDFLSNAAAPLTQRLATPLVPVVHGLWAVDDRVIIHFDASATTRAGKPYRDRFIWLFTLREGAVVEAEAFLDLVAYHQVIENTPLP